MTRGAAKLKVSSPGLSGRPSILRSGDARIEVVPIGIGLFDDADLPRPRPFLQALLAPDGELDVAESLEINQSSDAVAFVTPM